MYNNTLYLLRSYYVPNVIRHGTNNRHSTAYDTYQTPQLILTLYRVCHFMLTVFHYLF